MKEVKKLIAKIDTLISKQEYRSVKLHGVTCSRSDLEMTKFLAESYELNGNFNGLNVWGASKEIFDKLNIK